MPPKSQTNQSADKSPHSRIQAAEALIVVAEKKPRTVRAAAMGNVDQRTRLKLGRFEVFAAELDREIEQARQRTTDETVGRPIAIEARYESRLRRLLITLDNGCVLQIRVSLIEGLSEVGGLLGGCGPRSRSR